MRRPCRHTSRGCTACIRSDRTWAARCQQDSPRTLTHDRSDCSRCLARMAYRSCSPPREHNSLHHTRDRQSSRCLLHRSRVGRADIPSHRSRSDNDRACTSCRPAPTRGRGSGRLGRRRSHFRRAEERCCREGRLDTAADPSGWAVSAVWHFPHCMAECMRRWRLIRSRAGSQSPA